MSYTPTMNELREAWLSAEFEERDASTSDEDLRAEFDRALAAHDAEVRASAVSVGSGEPCQHIAEEPGVHLRPAADPGDYPAGTRWMCADGSVWETGWDAAEQQWAWVPVKQEGADQ